jgi:excisionase family DNA binding protein
LQEVILVGKKWLTTAEVAQALQLHPASVRRAVRENRIPGARRVPGGRLIRIPAAYVEELQEAKAK